jgi:hypothetical protein
MPNPSTAKIGRTGLRKVWKAKGMRPESNRDSGLNAYLREIPDSFR